jgi:hypothetical protein
MSGCDLSSNSRSGVGYGQPWSIHDYSLSFPHWPILVDIDFQGGLAMSVTSKVVRWLLKQSPNNSADPNPGTLPQELNIPGTSSVGAQPIEISTEEECMLGSAVSLGQQDSAVQDLGEALIRSHKNLYVICGCGHVACHVQATNKQGQQPTRGIAGKCYYCEEQYQRAFLKGKITLIEADRRSLVCTDCARLTVSGVLSCPSHYTAVTESDGQTIYLGPDERSQLERKQTIQKILTPFILLFSGQNKQQITKEDKGDE